MKVFAVFQEGVYRHECGGIFSTQEKAEACAKKLLINDDSYHHYDIIPFEIDTETPFTSRFGSYDFEEPAAIATF